MTNNDFTLRLSAGFFVAWIIVTLVSGHVLADGKPLSVEDLYKIPRLSQLEVSPAGDAAVFVATQFDMEDNSGRSSLWMADLRTNAVRRLTNAQASDWAPRWIDKGRVAFLSARSGTTQIWQIELAGGEAGQLTKLPVSISNFVVSPDGKNAAIAASVFPDCKTMACNEDRAKQKKSNKVKARVYESLPYRIWDVWRDERRGHVLWVSLFGKEEPLDLTPGNIQTPPLDLGGYMDLSISPDGKEVAFTANTTKNPAWNTNNDVYTVAVKGGVLTNISEDNKAVDAEPKYSPDGKYIAYLAMTRPGFEADRRVLTLYSRKSGRRIQLTDDLDRTVVQFYWRPNSKEIMFNAYDRGRKPIFNVSVPSGIVTKIVASHTNTDPHYVLGGDRIVFIRQTATTPAEVFVANGTGASIQRLSELTKESLRSIEMGKVEEFEYVGAGKDKIHGFMVLPPGFNSKKKYPLLMLIHGGPQGAFGDSFHPRWNLQMFAIPGFVVAAVNFHGSKGYGQKFCDAVSGDWGGKPYEDIMKGVDYLLDTHSYLAKENVSAAGASYGGFMINWILGHTERFRSLVSHDGVYDQVSMYGATEELWFPEWEFKGVPWKKPEQFDKYSPSAYAKNFKTPTLVVHGEHDYRVPYTQGLQLFTALQRQGVESKLLFFPDENHFVQKPQNARLWWNTVLGWLADHAKLKWVPEVTKKKTVKGKKNLKIAR